MGIPSAIQASRYFAPSGGNFDSAGEEPTAPDVPAAPDLDAGDTQISVSWSAVSGATTYDVIYNTSDTTSGATAFSGNPVSGTSAVITGLTNDTPYYVFVRATNAAGSSAYSSSATATPAVAEGVSGGSMETLAWNAPNGLADGETLVVNSSTHTFTAPDKYIYLGFGDGWLYSNPDGTVFPQTLTVGAEQFEYEYGIGEEARQILTVEGIAYLHTNFLSAENPGQVGAGMINWDTGGNMAPGDRPFMYRVG